MKTKTLLLILALLCGAVSNAFAQTAGTTVTKECKLGSSQTLEISEIKTGTPPFTYQWMKNGKPIPDAVSNRWYFSAISVADAGTYTVVVTNAAGSKVSNAAVITVALSLVAPDGITIIFRAN